MYTTLQTDQPGYYLPSQLLVDPLEDLELMIEEQNEEISTLKNRITVLEAEAVNSKMTIESFKKLTEQLQAKLRQVEQNGAQSNININRVSNLESQQQQHYGVAFTNNYRSWTPPPQQMLSPQFLSTYQSSPRGFHPIVEK